MTFYMLSTVTFALGRTF